jgi:hypothetical protein
MKKNILFSGNFSENDEKSIAVNLFDGYLVILPFFSPFIFLRNILYRLIVLKNRSFSDYRMKKNILFSGNF